MIFQFHVKGIDELESVTIKLLELSNSNNIFAFFGPMGAGKTTLIKAFCKLVKTVDVVSSPTFSLVNEYLTESGDAVYHFDFYRIDTIEEAFDIGYEHYFYSSQLCLIEWPEKIMQLLPDSYVKVSLSLCEAVGERVIDITII